MKTLIILAWRYLMGRKLRTTLTRLPRNLTGKDVNALDTRLGALMARPQMPKGAIPKNMRPSNLRMPRR